MTLRQLSTTAARLACAASLALSAHAFAGLFDDDEARRQIAEERKRVTELQGQLKQQNEAANARIGKLEEALKNQALLDLLTQIEALKLEVNKLRGQIEVLNNGVENAGKRQRDMYTDVDSRLKRLEQPAVPAAPTGAAPAETPAVAGGKPAAAPPPAATSAGATPAGTDPAEARAYETGQLLLRKGDYQGAVIAFQGFVKQYPKSRLASNAQYWIGDSYYNLRDYRLAIASQQQLIKGYPDSQKVSDAMLNIASAQIEMGETVAARKTMEEIVAKHPASEAAEKAKRRLPTIK